MKKGVFAIIQARMASTRLPGKVLKDLCGKPLLFHIIQRIKQVAEIDTVMIATSVHEEDDAIEAFARYVGVPCFRGSEEDVLARFYGAAKSMDVEKSDTIIRLTADNPLVDPIVLRDLLAFFKESPCNYASTCGYPLGLGAEVFTFQELEEAYWAARKPYEREHVTPYMYRDKNYIRQLVSPVDRSRYRFTVDTSEDFVFVEAIYHALYHGEHNFYLDDILEFIDQNPEVIEINCHVHQKRLGE